MRQKALVFSAPKW